MRSVKFPIVVVGGVFKEYELDKFQPLTRSITEMDALTLNDASTLVPSLSRRNGDQTRDGGENRNYRCL